ncbi:MAG: Glu/Leu/Phe/Val dehydrogenase, partial [Thermoanaerobaculia bacterium]|nr:Glu/Leu/Phe/Val dehydrogenase [Thermoanaerobaculia bacterium]
CDLELAGARVAVQGYGAVGRHAARLLADAGAVIVAVGDSGGTVVDAGGLDLDALDRVKAEGRSVGSASVGTAMERDAIRGVECDVWIPAARPDVLTAETVGELRARLVVQGANIPASDEAETWMHDNGVLSIPDFVANAGGVICGAVELHGGTEAQAVATIRERVGDNTRRVLERAQRDGSQPRAAALALARERIETAMGLRRRF